MAKKSAQLIDGKALAEKILLGLKGKISRLDQPPGLAAILIGDDPASQLYVKNKKKAAQKVGIIFHNYFCGNKLCPDVTEEEILATIDFLNNDPQIDGIIVQLPIPKKFNAEIIINRISPKKDVDCLQHNKKDDSCELPAIVSPLIQAIKTAITSTGENLAGKKAAIVAKNPDFSEARKETLTGLGLQVKIVKPDEDMGKQIKEADVMVVILGQKNLIKKSMVKPDAIVIDVGTNLAGKNKFIGDVDPKVAEVAGWLTPVPGGIGPLTVAFLLKNTYELAKKNQET